MRKASQRSSMRTIATLREEMKEPPPPLSQIYINNPDTLAILLKTSEVKCVIQALDLLYDLILENKKIGEDLLKKGILEDIYSLPRNNYPYYNGARYRFLSKIYLLFPHTRAKMMKETYFVHLAMDDIWKTEDTPLLAYALQYVSLITEKAPGLLKTLTDLYDFYKIFTDFLVHPDVDVQNNALALLRNLVRNPRTVKTILDMSELKFEPLCTQIACPYPDIQNKALDILDVLTSWPGRRRQWLQDMFNNAAGIDLLLTIILIFQWRDIHAKCLKILLNLTDSTLNLLNLDSVHGITRLVQYLDFIENEELKAKDMEILLNISKFSEGRLVLIQNEAIPAFVTLLEKGQEDTIMKASEGLRTLSLDSASIPLMSQYNPIPQLIELILDTEFSPELRCNAATTVNAIVKVVPVCALSFSKKENFERMVTVLIKGYPIDEECLSQILEAMSTVLSFPTQLKPLINISFCKILVNFLYEKFQSSPRMSIYAAEILSWCLYRQLGREIFICLGAVNDTMKILYKSTNHAILDAIGLLLNVAFKDQLLTECFIRAGVHSWLLISQSLWKTCPNLASATHVLFNSQLPLKLEYTGRLDVWDVTKDGFYVCRILENSEDFPILSDIMQNNESFNCSVYYLSMAVPSTAPIQPEDSISIYEIENEASQSSLSPSVAFETHGSALRLFTAAKKNLQSGLPIDKKLQEIYADIEKELQNSFWANMKGSRRLCKDWVENVAGVIGRKVAGVMSGQKQEGECTEHTFYLHLQELRNQLNSIVIPIGAIEVGLKLERAVLFKVLADRVELPCALVCGENAIGWVEVAVADTSEAVYKELPIRQLVTTHLVDLMDHPGKLISLESEGALKYCGLSPHPPLASWIFKPSSIPLGRPDEKCRGRQQFHIEIE